MAIKILEHVPWAVMKKTFSVKKWPLELALEEIVMETVPFWVQIREVPLCLAFYDNIKRLTKEAGEFLELEDPGKAHGFLRVRLLIDMARPLLNGCWLRKDQTQDTWVDFRYERLQDFCYRCGRIGHVNNECTFEESRGRAAGYGDWTKAPPVNDVVEAARPLSLGKGNRRQAGTVLVCALPLAPNQGEGTCLVQQWEATTMYQEPKVVFTSQGCGKKKWRRMSIPMMPTDQIQWIVPYRCNQSMGEHGKEPLLIGLS
ncbi:hypothetical protein COP2_035806 [Malus domestica]